MINTLQQHLDAAWEYIQIDNASLAMASAKQAHQLAPESPDVAHLLGLLASRDGNPNIALPLLQKSLDFGGKSERKLRDMAEALFSAGHAEQALVPLNEAIEHFGQNEALLGLRSAIEIDLGNYEQAEESARKAFSLRPSSVAWDLNLSFSALIQMKLESGFKYATSRGENLAAKSRCPALMFSKPCTIWLKGEQGLGDTLYYLRFIPPLVALGWQFHLEVDHKLITILNDSNLFASVKVKNDCPKHEFWINVGDLALMGQQCGTQNVPPPLELVPNAKYDAQFKQELSDLGPPPYIAVTWRAGPKGGRQQKGVRMLNKYVDPTVLGGALRNIKGTVISLQRLPTVTESAAFEKSLGKKLHNYSALNNNLAGMLALLNNIDSYITVSNTNLHLRESVGGNSHVLINRPFQDWRWLADGNTSPWYPLSTVYREDENDNWQEALILLNTNLADLAEHQNVRPKRHHSHVTTNINTQSNSTEIIDESFAQTIAEGWTLLSDNIPAAIAKAQTVLTELPEHARAMHLLAWAAVQDHQYALGVHLLQKAVAFAHTDGIIWRDYIRSLVLDNQIETALMIADACLDEPNIRTKSAIHYAKAGAYYKTGDNIKALLHYDKCREISPKNLDALGYAGMLRMKKGEGYARLGFKQYSGRNEAQHPHNDGIWCCPVLKGDLKGVNILISYDMGLGDELTYLRYMPWLIKAGATISYWCGAKLLPILNRLNWPVTLIPDTQNRPNPDHYDIAFIVNELPAAVEHLGAPEIAPPLMLNPCEKLIQQWKLWLAEQGDGPYVGINWRGGIANAAVSVSFSKLAKAIPANLLGEQLQEVNTTWISLQRNVTQIELNAFSQSLNSNIADAAGTSDDLDDMLALMSLLDANVGVSNTNMHLRAGLNLGSEVLVQHPGGDWRWGETGRQSIWFQHSTVYRQQNDGDWNEALTMLQKQLISRFGQHKRQTHVVDNRQTYAAENTLSKRIIWVSAGHIEKNVNGYYSELESAQERVINPAMALKAHGWKTVFVNEKMAEAMGGWQNNSPKNGDVVIFSKVVTQHALTLIKDAKLKGAYTVMDVFNDFSNNEHRHQHQQMLMQEADAIVSTDRLKKLWANAPVEINAYIENYTESLSDKKKNALTKIWDKVLNQLLVATHANQANLMNAAVTTKRVLVGMMYSGENEYEEAKQALAQQSHQHYQLIEVKNIANKLAHDTLYDHFMAHAASYDYFLKLDADMVLAHDNVLAEMVETMVQAGSAHLFAYVKDCPSGLMIPGIQMFKSDTRWLGSDEHLNVDYAPKLSGASIMKTDENWINHMPNPSNYQLFRYGIHKALKSLQPDRDHKNMKKGILHLSILNGITRQATPNTAPIFSLIGAHLVYQKAFGSTDYNSALTDQYYNILVDKPHKFEALQNEALQFWKNEVQVNYWWLDHFDRFKFKSET